MNGGCVASTTPLPFVQASTDPTAYNGQGVGYIQYHTPVPRIAQWNLSVQRALTTDFVAEVAYVASHGSGLNFPTDLNQIPQNLLSSNDSGDRPYSNFQSIQGSTNNAVSNYNSLQASITKRMTHGVSLSFNYVWSHMLDDMDSSGWGSRAGPQDFQIASIPGANYSNSNFDVRHAFKGYAVYQLPFGTGKQFLNGSRLLDEAIGGWQLSGTLVLSTGNPFTVTGTQNTYAQAGASYPNWVPGVSTKPANRSISNWFNPAAFSQPARWNLWRCTEKQHLWAWTQCGEHVRQQELFFALGERQDPVPLRCAKRVQPSQLRRTWRYQPRQYDWHRRRRSAVQHR